MKQTRKAGKTATRNKRGLVATARCAVRRLETSYRCHNFPCNNATLVTFLTFLPGERLLEMGDEAFCELDRVAGGKV